jgi:hypothetical protein
VTAIWVWRNPTKAIMGISMSLCIMSAFFVTMATFGEQVTFEHNLRRDDYLGYFLRKHYTRQFGIKNS